MEILTFYEHRRRKVWFSSLRTLVTLIMVTSVGSIQGTPSITTAMDTEAPSSLSSDHLSNIGTKSSLFSEKYPSSQSSEDSNEDAFWDGVEEVDLTIPVEDLTIEEDLEESFYLFFNESMFLDIDCETFSLMAPPPSWTKVPSPPLPPFLGTVSYDLRSYNLDIGTDGSVTSSVNTEEEEEDQECNLCKWVAVGNQTLDFLAKKESEETTSSTRSMVGIMVGVAIVSAAIGAAIMSFLLKCKRNTGESSCLRNSCPVVIQRRRSPKSSSNTSKRNDNNEGTDTTQVETSKSGSSPGAGWHLKMWKRNATLPPVNACSSPVSESSYIEDQYVNCDASSSVYAELNSEEGLVLSGPKITSNTYSEIANGELPSETKTNSQGNSKCNNENYITTDPERNESSAGSASTPSSAYYSDVSSYDICSSAKGKLKGSKTDNITDTNKQYTIKAISKGVEFHPIRQEMRAINLDNLPLNSTTVSSPSLQLLPKQLNTDHNYMLNSIPRYHQNISHPLNLPSNYILHGMDKCEEGCSHHPRLNPQTQNTFGHYEGMYEENMMPVRHYPGISRGLPSISNQRPLPALPSRRISGPKKKRFNPQIENGAVPLESNYV